MILRFKIWELDEPMPGYLLKESRKLAVG